jgi:hypothetical protein
MQPSACLLLLLLLLAGGAAPPQSQTSPQRVTGVTGVGAQITAEGDAYRVTCVQRAARARGSSVCRPLRAGAARSA